jgi:TRAP-type transport system periplasmic protein
MKKLTAALAATTALAGPAAAEDVLSAVHAFPTTLIYTQSFLEFVDKVNERGEGVVRIEVRGGPEAIGLFQQADAVRDGVVDMAYTPGSFYAGAFPERDALVASNITAIEARENGGIDLINEIHQEKMGVYYLGWFDSGVTYNLWTVNEPALDAEGNLDVSGIRLRGNPVYNAFFTNYLGASVIDLPTTDVYSGLERNMVDATGWTQIGLMDLRWDEFVRYRIEPSIFSTDLGVIVNLEKWNSLSEEARPSCRRSRSSTSAARSRHCGARRRGARGALEEAAA